MSEEQSRWFYCDCPDCTGKHGEGAGPIIPTGLRHDVEPYMEHAHAGDNDLVERLGGPHEWGYRCITNGTFIKDDSPFEAATALEAKDAIIKGQTEGFYALQASFDSRIKEISKLRGALEKIADTTVIADCDQSSYVFQIARAALSLPATMENSE